MTPNKSDSGELRDRITLIKANNLYAGLSLAQVNKIPKPYLDKLEAETDEIMAVVTAHIQAIGEEQDFRDIKQERESLKITQADMAIIIGVSRLTLIKYEKDMNAMPIGAYRKYCAELERLAQYLGDKE